MWPWEHLAVAYVVVSLWRRYRSGRPPSGAEAVAAVVASQLPDLVDKPLGWGTSLLPSGTSLAHSLPGAVTTCAVVYLVSRRLGRGDVGVAFGLAYLSHLPADVIYPVILGGSPKISFLFWPVVEQPPSQTGPLAGRVLELATQFVEFLGTTRGLVFLALEAALVVFTFVLWWRDGWPILAAVRRFLAPASGRESTRSRL